MDLTKLTDLLRGRKTKAGALGLLCVAVALAISGDYARAGETAALALVAFGLRDAIGWGGPDEGPEVKA